MIEKASISVERDGNTATITGGGALTFIDPNYSEFRDGLKVASKEAEAVTVDLREAEFIDTAIVQDLARAGVTLMNRGKRLKVLITETAYPYRVLQISGFKEIMDIEVGPWES